jgi:hypothetical protein
MTKPLIIDGEEYVRLKDVLDFVRQNLETDPTWLTKSLNLRLSMLFQKGIYQPIDIVVYLLIIAKNGHKEGVVFNDDIMNKLRINEKKYLNSIKRLETHGVLASRTLTNEELEDVVSSQIVK